MSSDGVVSFNQIPVNLLTPGQYVEFDNSQAVNSPVNMPNRIMLIAPMSSAGTAVPNVPFQVSGASDGVSALGRGSIGAGMLNAIFDVTDTIETWVLPVADSVAGQKATGTLTFTGVPTAGGTINFYLAGVRVQVGVSVNDTPSTIAAALVAAINADPDLYATATAAAGVVTLTANNKGTAANDLDMRFNFYPMSESTPAGIAIAIGAFAGGTGDPSIATAIAAIGATQYNTFLTGFADASNLALISTELDTRWGPLYQNDGHCHVGLRGTVGSINTALSASNSPHIDSWTCEVGGEPGPVWEKAALAGTVASYYLSIDPARPLQTLTLPGRLPASAEKRFIRSERNNILSYGGGTTIVDANGNVVIERAVTNYTVNAAGLVDPSYRDIETMYTLSLMRYQVRARIAQKFPRFKLVANGTQIAPGQAMTTPDLVRAELIALGLDWVDAGLMEDITQFKTDLLAVRNANDQDRVDVRLPPNLVNQFRVFAAQVQFRL
jgi:phage tail sheath gpL-like